MSANDFVTSMAILVITVIVFAFLLFAPHAHGATVTEYKANVSAYCPCNICCEKYGWGYRTASNYKIKPGDHFVAAPKNIPFGTTMIIPGYNKGKPVKVLDRGGAIKGNKIDLYFDTHKEALQWGRRHITIRVSGGKP